FAVTAAAREQPAGPKKKTDQDLIQGIWDIVGLESGGKAQPAANYKGNTFLITRDKAVLREGVNPFIEFTFALEPAKTPRSIELTTIKGNSVHGIYKLDGDDLTLTVSLSGTRPGDFATRTGGDSETFILKRSQWERYSDKNYGFAADFPTRPTESKRD